MLLKCAKHFGLDGGRRFATPMDLLGQINYGEMLSGLIVTTFLIVLNASVVVVSSMVMFPLIDLAFKKKAKPAPRPAQVETWQSGRPWLALRSDFLQSDAVPPSPLPLVGMAHNALAPPPLEHTTPLKVRLLVPEGSEGAPTGPVTAPPTQHAMLCGRSAA